MEGVEEVGVGEGLWGDVGDVGTLVRGAGLHAQTHPQSVKGDRFWLDDVGMGGTDLLDGFLDDGVDDEVDLGDLDVLLEVQ